MVAIWTTGFDIWVASIEIAILSTPKKRCQTRTHPFCMHSTSCLHAYMVPMFACTELPAEMTIAEIHGITSAEKSSFGLMVLFYGAIAINTAKVEASNMIEADWMTCLWLAICTQALLQWTRLLGLRRYDRKTLNAITLKTQRSFWFICKVTKKPLSETHNNWQQSKRSKTASSEVGITM